MKAISILIPTYNFVCYHLAATLHQQAELLGIEYEIIVADDGSTLQNTIEENAAINHLSHCKYLKCHTNRGRAAIRNYLVQESRLSWLLFIDSDMVITQSDFLERYAKSDGEAIVYGGIMVHHGGLDLRHNLRYRYEKAAEKKHHAKKRAENPYKDFHTANFMVRRDIMVSTPFDARFKHYGYEDVLFGKQMERLQIAIEHIENPVSFEVFESNADFIKKTEEGLRTLYQFRHELKGYSRILDHADGWPHILFRYWHKLMGSTERRWLTGTHVSLMIFQLYRMGYFISLYSGKGNS